MDGTINVNKPTGMTSSDVVYRLRKILRMKKIGHMGTLDPDAGGVLPVGVGNGTRLTEYHSVQDKTYHAELTLGVVTDTQDASGRILSQQIVGATRAELEQTLSHFRGDLLQTPPMYSAVRHEGRRLYDLARQGAEVERTPRPIRVDILRLLSWQDGELPRAELEVVCSKGTYIRTLCHDIGARLGCGGHMSRLQRTRVGCWTLEDAWTLEDIAARADKGDDSFLQEIGFGLELPRMELAEVRRQAFANGLVTEGFCQGIAPENLMSGTEQEKIVQVYCQGILLGIGRWQEGCLYPVKVMVSKDIQQIRGNSKDDRP